MNSSELREAEMGNLLNLFKEIKVKGVFLAVVVIILGAATSCSSTLSTGDKTMDNTHEFSLLSAQVIEKVGEDTPPGGQVYLVIKYEVGNLQGQNDSLRRWTDQVVLEGKEERYALTFINSLGNQLWETSLLPGQTKMGYIAFTVPTDVLDFKMTFTFPTSEKKVIYEFKPVDKRISINVDYILTRLEQMERTQRIPLIGGNLDSFTSSPIMYRGIILVPEEDIPSLLDQIKGAQESSRRKIIEDYLVTQGRCSLE